MASATTQSVTAPSGTQDNKVVQFSKASQVGITVPARDENGDPAYMVVDAPLGSHALYNAPRQIGDWYAEFTAGKRLAAATGADQITAIRAAALKMQAAA